MIGWLAVLAAANVVLLLAIDSYGTRFLVAHGVSSRSRF